MAVVQDMQKKIEPLLKEAQTGGKPEEIRPKVMKIRKEHEGKIEAILNDTQKKQWKEMLGKPYALRPGSRVVAAVAPFGRGSAVIGP